MTLQQLKYVIEIAECGSITTAEENLFCPNQVCQRQFPS